MTWAPPNNRTPVSFVCINVTLPRAATVRTPLVLTFSDQTGKPLTNLSVTIGDEKFKVTVPSGKFEYVPQKEGQLTIMIERPNYQTRSVTIQVGGQLLQPILLAIGLVIAAAIAFSFYRPRPRYK